MIPSFLLLRDLHLLNTYWALLLPSAANGFTIFMMKGFFDTLPREVFEAAKIDGASELRMFFRILLPLCKPVFGFFALGAFTAAYSGFIWAFTICPKEEMWTMMVWLYQLTTMQPPGVQMAALVIAALPTLVVFTVVQNIILKGIVLPTYH
jgi:ABC-type glycerol-3-phosphate transport system permease component